MTSEARALGQALLDHHKMCCRNIEVVTDKMSDSLVYEHCISYGVLVERAHYPCMPHFVGPFLYEIALWCEEKGWPPLHSLAVNKETKIPGESYQGAPGGGFAQWPVQVRKCISFRGYPDRMP